jgi:hypothetical protein
MIFLVLVELSAGKPAVFFLFVAYCPGIKPAVEKALVDFFRPQSTLDDPEGLVCFTVISLHDDQVLQ